MNGLIAKKHMAITNNLTFRSSQVPVKRELQETPSHTTFFSLLFFLFSHFFFMDHSFTKFKPYPSLIFFHMKTNDGFKENIPLPFLRNVFCALVLYPCCSL